MPLSFVFFGTPNACVPLLEILHGGGWTPRAVVCQPDRPRGRGCQVVTPPTKDWAEGREVPVLQPAACQEPGFLEEILALEPDLGLVFAFGQLLPGKLLSIPRLGFVNIHPSLLPRYRGAAPVQWTLIHGDDQAGVSILRMTPRLDDGDILLQQTVRVDPNENAVELGERLVRLGGELAVRALGLLEHGQDRWRPQDEAEVVWAPALKKQDGRIDWARPALELHNRIRGVQPWPGASTTLGGRHLKIHRAAPGSASCPQARPGEVVRASGDDLWVRAGEGLLRLLEVQLEGRNRMAARAFLAGRGVREGDVLS